jgi:hypothetical protein
VFARPDSMCGTVSNGARGGVHPPAAKAWLGVPDARVAAHESRRRRVVEFAHGPGAYLGAALSRKQPESKRASPRLHR